MCGKPQVVRLQRGVRLRSRSRTYRRVRRPASCESCERTTGVRRSRPMDVLSCTRRAFCVKSQSAASMLSRRVRLWLRKSSSPVSRSMTGCSCDASRIGALTRVTHSFLRPFMRRTSRWMSLAWITLRLFAGGQSFSNRKVSNQRTRFLEWECQLQLQRPLRISGVRIRNTTIGRDRLWEINVNSRTRTRG